MIRSEMKVSIQHLLCFCLILALHNVRAKDAGTYSSFDDHNLMHTEISSGSNYHDKDEFETNISIVRSLQATITSTKAPSLAPTITSSPTATYPPSLEPTSFISNDEVFIKSADTGDCLQLIGTSALIGPCGEPGTSWIVGEKGFIRPFLQQDQCLAVNEGAFQDRLGIEIDNCSTNELRQRWEHDSTGRFRSLADSNYCLDHNYEDAAYIWPCDSTFDQVFKIVKAQTPAPSDEPTITSTKAPSSTRTPSHEPTITSTKAPSYEPTITSTKAPSLEPSTKPVTCVDSELTFNFKKPNGDFLKKTCKWIKKNKKKWCQSVSGVSKSCPGTCDSCSDCNDSPYEFKIKYKGNNKWVKCTTWVKKDTTKRCKISGVKKACRKTCKKC